MISTFDAVYRYTDKASNDLHGRPVSPPAVPSHNIPSATTGKASGDVAAVELVRTLSENDGLRITLGKDELGREVEIHQLLPNAGPDRRRSFESAVSALSQIQSRSFPELIRGTADTFIVTRPTGPKLSEFGHVDIVGPRGDDLVWGIVDACKALISCIKRGIVIGELSPVTIIACQREGAYDVIFTAWSSLLTTSSSSSPALGVSFYAYDRICATLEMMVLAVDAS